MHRLLQEIWTDAAYRGTELAEWCRQQGAGWDLEIVDRAPGTAGFHFFPRSWAATYVDGFSWRGVR